MSEFNNAILINDVVEVNNVAVVNNAAGTGKRNGRGKKYTKAEDKDLCKNWKNVSVDGVKGTDQNYDTMWGNILSLFNEKKAESKTRTLDSLKKRWGIISKEVSSWSSAYAQVKRLNKSGNNEADNVSNA